MPQITVKQLDNAKPKNKPYRLTADKGLYLHISCKGSKTWQVRYTVNGVQLTATLPLPYGNKSGQMSLAEACEKNANIQALARRGIDFKIQEKIELRTIAEEQAEEEERDKTFLELYNTWLEDGVNRKDNNDEIKRSFNKDVLPYLKNLCVKDITEADIRRLLRKVINDRGASRMAVCLHTDLIQLFSWAERRKPWRSLLIEGNPAQLIDIKTIISPEYENTQGIRRRVLSTEEIRELRDIFETTTRLVSQAPKGQKRNLQQPLSKKCQLAVWITLSTLCRIGELSCALWKHVDFSKSEWFIPKENVKTTRGIKQDLLVFLSPFALRQFRELYNITGSSEYIFPNRFGTDHIYEKAITRQISDRQLMFKDVTNTSSRHYSNQLVLANGKNGNWIMHDLRRTGATLMQMLKVEERVVDRCQNHVVYESKNKIRRHYQLYDFADEKKEAWLKLGSYIENILLLNSNLLFLNDTRVA